MIKVKKKIAESVKEIMMEVAQKNVGKSFPLGTYEVSVPKELMLEKELEKK